MWSRASTFSSLGFYSIILRSSRFKQHCCMRSGTSHGSVLHVILLILVIIPSPLILKNNWWNHELTDVQAGFRKGRGTKDKLPTSAGSSKKQESSRKTSISALLTMPKPLITINHGKFGEMGISDHLTCLLRNLYTGQEATVRSGHGTTHWFQIGKGVHQGCILSPCLLTYM